MSLYNLPAEKILLQKIAHGDEYAFRQVFELYKNSVYTFVLRFVHSRADAEEIVQDTFFTIWQKRDTLPDIEHPRNYIYTIVRNKTYTYLNQVAKNKQAMAQLWANMQTESNDIVDFTDLNDSKALIESGLRNLSPQKQEIFNLSREKGMSHEEIALHVGLSKSRVKNIMVDVLKYLRYYLEMNTIVTFLIFLLS